MAEIVLCSLIIQAGMPAPRTKPLLFQVSKRYTAFFFLIWRVLRDLDRIVWQYPHTQAQQNHNPILPAKGIYRGRECYDGESRTDLSSVSVWLWVRPIQMVIQMKGSRTE